MPERVDTKSEVEAVSELEPLQETPEEDGQSEGVADGIFWNILVERMTLGWICHVWGVFMFARERYGRSEPSISRILLMVFYSKDIKI